MYPGAHCETHPDKPAIVMAGSGRQLSYRELHEYAQRFANLLWLRGLRPGHHLALCVENRLEFLALCWGAHYLGLRYTAISSRLTATEVAFIVTDCGARAVVCTPATAGCAPAPADTPDVEVRLCVGGAVTGHEPLEPLLEGTTTTPLGPRVEGSDMLYSSGTTGRPKGIELPRSGAALGTPDNLVALLGRLFGATGSTRYLSPAPLYHAAPLRFCRTMHRLGATVVVMEHFDARDALALIERHRITMVQMVPTMFVRLLKLPDAERLRHDVSSLESVVHAAAPCPVAVKEQMIEWWGPVIHEYYAGTEGNGFVYCSSQDWLAHRGSVGAAISGVVHICDEDGNELPVGEEGVVYFGDGPTFAYHNDPAGTAAASLPNGWTTLGDVGRLDADGFLYLTDRRSFMIISGGVNIYPQEAENVLTMHPAVVDVAVFGIPDDDLGEVVKAVVQPVDPSAAGPALEAELIRYCTEHLARHKCPRSVDFRAELPRHPTGKLYKRILRDEYRRAAESS